MAERKDKIVNKAQVAKSLLKDPTQSQRQIAEDTWLSLGNVNDKVWELEQSWTESQIMDRILESDTKIIDLVNGIHLKEIEEKVANWEKLTLQDHKLLWDLANNSTKRKAIFDKGEKKANENITIQI